MKAVHTLFALGLAGLFLAAAMPATGAPLSVRVEDHDFSFDVPYWPTPPGPWGAVYSFNGAAPDSLTLQAANPNHYAVSYSYTGALPPVGGPAASAFPYLITNSATFGGDLKLDMTFAVNDGPYVDPNTGDRFDISLVGTSGSLTITGQIWSQGFPPAAIFPAAPVPSDIVLLSIVFDKVTLLARVNEDRIFKIEGSGTPTVLLGETMPQLLPKGAVVAFDFIAKNPLGSIFTNPNYSPTDNLTTFILGDINGHAGVPEPATMAMLVLGGAGLFLAKRRRG
jgi:hypothetical protein